MGIKVNIELYDQFPALLAPMGRRQMPVLKRLTQ